MRNWFKKSMCIMMVLVSLFFSCGAATVAEAATVAVSGSTVTLLHDTTEDVTFEKGVILDVNGCTAPNVSVTTPVAKVNGVEFYSLNDAFAAADDGRKGRCQRIGGKI